MRPRFREIVTLLEARNVDEDNVQSESVSPKSHDKKRFSLFRSQNKKEELTTSGSIYIIDCRHCNAVKEICTCCVGT